MALDLWVEFFDDLQNVRGRSRNTVLAYRRDLGVYEEFINKHNEITFIYEFLKSRNLSTRSQARVIASIRTYLKYCETQGRKVPELRQLRQPKVKVSLPKAITVDEFHKLFSACVVDNPFKTARNQITLLLLFGLGCRVTELIGLELKDFSETEGWLSVTGKGGKQRLIPLTETLQSELSVYLSDVRQVLLKTSTQSILLNDRGKCPSRVDVWRWLASWSARAGFPEPISPHKFRHGCATALLESGADLRSIQMLLGHSSIQTTQIYTNVTTKKISEVVDEHHPLSKLD